MKTLRNEDCVWFLVTEKTWQRKNNNMISGSWKIGKKKIQGHHSKFEFLECCSKNADIPRASPPWGSCILSQPRNSNFDWWPCKGISLIFWKSKIKARIFGFFVFWPWSKLWKSNSKRFYWTPMALEPCPSCRSRKQNFKVVVSGPLYDRIRPYFFQLYDPELAYKKESPNLRNPM